MKNILFLLLVLFSIVSIPLTLQEVQKRQISLNRAQSENSTAFLLSVFFHGIGASGDSTNPTDSRLSNKNPTPAGKDVTVTVYTTSDQLVKSQSGYLYFMNTEGNFTGIIDMGTIPTGDYIIKIKSNGFLQKSINGTVHVTALTQLDLPGVTLVAGDVTGDNKIDILDYNMIMGCYSDILTAQFCDNERQLLTDFNSDGNVDMRDLNLFLREISVQNGE